MSRKITTVVLDWAGTAVDFGSMAPVAAFKEAFEAVGLSPGNELIRYFMGLPKKDHVRKMLRDKEMTAVFIEKYGKAPDEEAVEFVYEKFEPALFEVLKDHAAPLPGVPETVRLLREEGVRIGSTTGYTRAMMDVLCPVSKARGYEPDCLVCPDDVGGKGRPYPYMLWENLRRLDVCDIREVCKIGDTAADIIEGKNAGCISVGVVFGSNMLGLSEEEYGSAGQSEIERLAETARGSYSKAGADYIIENITELSEFIKSINKETP